MWKRIRNIFKTDSQGKLEGDPSVLIQRAIHEMNRSVQDSNVAIKNAQIGQYEIQRKLDMYKDDAARLQKEAMDFVKKKKDNEAKQALVQKALIDKQVAQYETLNNNILQTISHLQFQQQQMKLKIDELHTKEVLLSAKLTNAKTQAEISQQLSELSQFTDLHFDQLEQDALHIESVTNVLNSLQTDSPEAEVNKILGQFPSVEKLNNSFETLLLDIDKEERERQRVIDEAKNKKVDLLFSQLKSGDKQDSAVNNTPKMENKVNPDEFFKSTENKVVKKVENVVDGFFANTQSKVVREESDKGKGEDTPKKDLLDDFFKQAVEKEENKDDKKKLLDDFFK